MNKTEFLHTVTLLSLTDIPICFLNKREGGLTASGLRIAHKI